MLFCRIQHVKEYYTAFSFPHGGYLIGINFREYKLSRMGPKLQNCQITKEVFYIPSMNPNLIFHYFHNLRITNIDEHFGIF